MTTLAPEPKAERDIEFRESESVQVRMIILIEGLPSPSPHLRAESLGFMVIFDYVQGECDLLSRTRFGHLPLMGFGK